MSSHKELAGAWFEEGYVLNEVGCRGAKFLLVSEVSAVFLCTALSADSGSQRPGLL